MIEYFQRIGQKLLAFIVGTIHRLTILATLISIAVCLVFFFINLFTGEPTYALLCLAGMMCCVYVNKQF